MLWHDQVFWESRLNLFKFEYEFGEIVGLNKLKISKHIRLESFVYN